MKKIFSLFVVAFLATNLIFAQAPIPNGGFETWSSGNPTGWGNSDKLITTLGQPDPGGVEQDTAIKYSGTSSVRLTNKSVTLPVVGTRIIPGVVSLGNITLNFVTFSPEITGYAYTDRPDSLTFAAKFTSAPGTSDTGVVAFTLTASTPNGRVLVANSIIPITDLASFQLFTVKVNYHSMLTPDTLLIQGIASNSQNATVDTKMWLDAMSVSGLDTAFKAYINPFRNSAICSGDTVHFGTDADGNNTYQWYNGGTAINGQTQPTYDATTSGSYSVQVTKGGVLYTSDTISIVQNALPTVNLNLPVTAVCLHTANMALSGGSPAGGQYTGTGVDTSGTFSPNTAGTGTHAVTYTYTDNNGCSAKSTENIVVSSACTGIEVLEPGLKVNIYPNPSNNFMLVESDSKLVGGTIELFDMQGRPVLKETISAFKSQLNVQQLAAGNYTVRLSNTAKKVVANAQITVTH